jgi:ATP-dependent helicase Lhr and Lhr-like helicase
MEARGEIRGGRFVAGYVGEQYALPDAIDALRAARRSPDASEPPEVATYDPLHIAHTLMPGAPPRPLRSAQATA